MRLHGKHFFEAFYHGTVAGFPFSAVVCVIKAEECVMARIGPGRKVHKKGGE
jgi:hypothetical protein